MNAIKSAILGVLISLVAACGWFSHHHSLNHGCFLAWNNDKWQNADMHLYDDDPRTCPVGATTGSTVTAGATLTQGAYAESTDLYHAYTSVLSIYNTNDNCTEQAFGSPLSTDEEDFGWHDYLNLGSNQWSVQTWATFTAGTGVDNNSDCAVYTVDMYADDAVAKTHIHYTGEQW